MSSKAPSTSVRDADLQSVQQARMLVERAREAWDEFAHFPQERVDRIVEAAATAGSEAAARLARLAVDETGFGIYEHKFIKNKFAADGVYASIKDLKTVGIIAEYPDRGVFEIAEPVGVVAAVIPSTNPTSTTVFKILIALKSRNAIVISPHPSARACILETVEILRRAAEAAGLPAGVVSCMTEVSIEGTQELMRHRRTAVILATGGMGLVRAAYSSGKPAYGVGPGNVPAYIESSADVDKAVRDVITGKSYDNGTLCCSEQALICDRSIEERVRAAVVDNGGLFLSKEQIDALSKVAVLPSRLANPKIVGKGAPEIAKLAGISVPPDTRALVVDLEGVGRDYPLSIEKLSPILAFYVVDDWRQGCERSKQVLAYGGMGHTLSIHSQNDEIIREFALQKPASRIIANSPATHGAVGFSTGLAASFTLGCGSYGGNITSDNITPLHLINTKRLAYEIRGVDIRKALQEYGFEGEATRTGVPAAPARPVLEERVDAYLVKRGIVGSEEASTPLAAFEGDIGTTRTPEAEAPPSVVAREFIAEEDVREAMAAGRKLPVGPTTVITPSAKDLGNEKNVFLHV